MYKESEILITEHIILHVQEKLDNLLWYCYICGNNSALIFVKTSWKAKIANFRWHVVVKQYIGGF
jgi:hypothetical protein